MKAWQAILVGVLILAFGLIATAIAMPNAYVVERSVDIRATPAMTYAFIEDLERHPAWSPVHALQPPVEISLGPITLGDGASFTWLGPEGRNGSARFVSAEAPRRIVSEMHWGDQGPIRGVFALSSLPDGTRVTWSVSGQVEGVFGGVFAMQVERQVGPHLLHGLERLRGLSEAASRDAASANEEEPLAEGSEPLGMLPPIP